MLKNNDYKKNHSIIAAVELHEILSKCEDAGDKKLKEEVIKLFEKYYEKLSDDKDLIYVIELNYGITQLEKEIKGII